MLCVAVVDDHTAVREGLRRMLDDEQGLRCIGAAATAAEAVWLACEEPAVMLLDYHLPDEDGLSLCLRLKTADRASPPSVVIYSAFADEDLAVLALIAGADAVISKTADPDELCQAVRTVGLGHAGRSKVPHRAMAVAAARLDAADLPILGMLANRIAPNEIAETLAISEQWLAARRWAMLERLAGRVARRRPTRRGAGADSQRSA